MFPTQAFPLSQSSPAPACPLCGMDFPSEASERFMTNHVERCLTAAWFTRWPMHWPQNSNTRLLFPPRMSYSGSSFFWWFFLVLKVRPSRLRLENSVFFSWDFFPQGLRFFPTRFLAFSLLFCMLSWLTHLYLPGKPVVICLHVLHLVVLFHCFETFWVVFFGIKT